MEGINKLLYNKQDNELDKMLTKEEVMDHLHLKDYRSFNKLLKQGLPHIQILNRILVPQKEYEKWIKNKQSNHLE